jgi:hypothetical protein
MENRWHGIAWKIAIAAWRKGIWIESSRQASFPECRGDGLLRSGHFSCGVGPTRGQIFSIGEPGDVKTKMSLDIGGYRRVQRSIVANERNVILNSPRLRGARKG